MDDILIFSTTWEIHTQHIRSVLGKIQNAGLTISPKKCEWGKKSIEFLGHIINSEGMATDPEKIRCLKEIPEPTTRKEIQQFLGLVNYYRKFIKNCAKIVHPISKLLRNDQC